MLLAHIMTVSLQKLLQWSYYDYVKFIGLLNIVVITHLKADEYKHKANYGFMWTIYTTIVN